jgi:hypothetical protein
MTLLESLAYSIARGITRGALDAYFERLKTWEESPNADDHRRAALFRSAVLRQNDNTGQTNPAQSSGQGNADGVGQNQGGGYDKNQGHG